MNLHTTSAVAAMLGVATATVTRWCVRLRMRKFGRSWALTDEDVERLKDAIPGRVGNPEFGSERIAKLALAARRKRRQ